MTTRTVYVGPSAITLVEERLLFLALEAIALGVIGYLIYQRYGLNSEQSQEAATQEVTGGYPTNDSTTIPNPSVFSDQNPVTPWMPPGPPA